MEILPIPSWRDIDSMLDMFSFVFLRRSVQPTHVGRTRTIKNPGWRNAGAFPRPGEIYPIELRVGLGRGPRFLDSCFVHGK